MILYLFSQLFNLYIHLSQIDCGRLTTVTEIIKRHNYKKEHTHSAAEV